MYVQSEGREVSFLQLYDEQREFSAMHSAVLVAIVECICLYLFVTMKNKYQQIYNFVLSFRFISLYCFLCRGGVLS